MHLVVLELRFVLKLSRRNAIAMPRASPSC